MSSKRSSKNSHRKVIIDGLFVVLAAVLAALAVEWVGMCSGNKQVPVIKYASKDTTSSPIAEISKPDTNDSQSHDDSPKAKQAKPPVISTNETTPVVYYQIKVHVSSKMKDASFFVDNEPAQIIDDLTTVKVIRIKKKDSNHTISVKKDSLECSKQLFINQNNVAVILCP